jgi:50S ribosomal subunit-associated GTPase HflX
VLRLPDPEWDVIQRLEERIAELEARVEQFESRKAPKRNRKRTNDAEAV